MGSRELADFEYISQFSIEPTKIPYSLLYN
jgi:hypothetical protein